ncbi:MAG: hypothetical protein RI554_06875, partial [Trueperaceae bacterium]|nr:hypothetical protein [Trueperaceae bacterium]
MTVDAVVDRTLDVVVAYATAPRFAVGIEGDRSALTSHVRVQPSAGTAVRYRHRHGVNRARGGPMPAPSLLPTDLR